MSQWIAIPVDFSTLPSSKLLLVPGWKEEGGEGVVAKVVTRAMTTKMVNVR